MEEITVDLSSVDLEDERLIQKYSNNNNKSGGKERGGARGEACKIFHCTFNAAAIVKGKGDPFNRGNRIDGFLCKKEGKMGGSVYITHVNGKRTQQSQLIYGTPKLEYPYRDFDTQEYKDFSLLDPECHSYFIANKWNGCNVLFYKYKDADGKVFVTAKSKGSAFLNDSPFGPFFTLTRQVLKLKESEGISIDKLPSLLQELKDDNVQSKTFELCGKKEPHLVKYDFDIDLKPLFVTYMDGSITPCPLPGDVGEFPFTTNVELVNRCQELQEQDFEANELFRKENQLEHKYEYDHFIREGRVLYPLDDHHKLIKRTMYKVKPKDIEEVHWSNFDATIQGRVREALEKLVIREKSVTSQTLQEELDMGPKEWSRFGTEVMKYAQQLTKEKIPLTSQDHRHVILVGGYPGSGRFEFVRELASDTALEGIITTATTTTNHNNNHNNNNTTSSHSKNKKKKNLKKKKEKEEEEEESTSSSSSITGWRVVGSALVPGTSWEETQKEFHKLLLSKDSKVIVDTLNISMNQRKTWMEEAHKWGVLRVDCVMFDSPKEKASVAATATAHHQSNHHSASSSSAWIEEAFKTNLTIPLARDGFTEIHVIHHDDSASMKKVLDHYRQIE